MRKLFTLFTLLLLCLLPITALAVEGAPSSLYVGNQQVIGDSDITYWTTDEGGNLAQSAAGQSWNVKYDQTTATLSLKNANISGKYDQFNNPYTAGIYAQGSNGQPVALTIELIGTNTITGTLGIYVNAQISTSSIGTDASLVIKNSSDNGSLTVTGTDSYGLYVVSGTGDASLTINDASVVASSSGSYSRADVFVQSGASATNSLQLSLSVNGGSLTASGTGSNAGIQFHVGNSSASATTSLTVSGNAIVDARTGGIEAYQLSTLINTNINATGTSGGIVFDGTEGTVYGTVELQDDLTINQGETLAVPSGSSLNCNGNLTNKGTILASGGTVTGSLSGGSTVTTPNITVQPSDNTVTEGTQAAFSVTATAGDETPTYQWQQSTDSGSNWTNIESATSAKYTTEATTISMSGYQYRCVVKSASGVGVISQAATLTVTQTSNYFEISSAEQLRNFANAVNEGNTTANAVLTADIDLGDVAWTPIGKDNDHMYNGTFDGQGHTISGLYANISSDAYVGLFGCIGSGGTVENVTVEASSLSASATGDNACAYAGSVCGLNYGTITNCTSTGTVTAKGDYAYAGGVCGRNYGSYSGNTAAITNCTSAGTVIAEGDAAAAGGVCGENYAEGGTATISVSDYYSTGTVTSNATSGKAYAGGVCGQNYAEGGTAAITNCASTGTVTSEGPYAYAGGVCGQNYANGSDVTAAISNCTSTGAVTTEGPYAYAGGVCGYFDGGNIKNCYSTGTVTSTATATSGATYAGGVCGYFDGGNIKNCYSTGAVTSNATSDKAYAGGVCGSLGSGNIKNCYSTGTVTSTVTSGKAYAGGVCGWNEGTITNCYWLADSPQGGIGGGSGTVENVESKTTDQFASGEVAWLLNGQQTGGPWRQGSNGMPVLEGNLPEGVTSYVPICITIVMPDDTQKSYYSAEGGTLEAYPVGYAFFLEEGNTQTWINKGTQTYDSNTTIYAETMTLKKIPAKAATCTEKGNSEYWYCETYDKYFSDENGVNEITAASTVLPATGHQLTKVTAKEPTCTQAGNIEYWVCNNCGKYFRDENATEELTDVVIPATGHHYVNGTCTVCGHRDPDYRPDPISYYNIYVEDVCDGVEVTTSKNVVREGGSISLYVEKDTANYTFDNFKVYYKRSYYGPWEVLEEGTQPGEYPINNIWTHIYVKAEGAVEKEDPTGIEQVEGVKVYTKDGSLYVQTPQREQVLVITMTGVVVKNEEQVGLKQYHGLQPGIYVVRAGNVVYKVRLH